MAENVNRLKKNGILVWLDTSPEALAERLGLDRRSARLRPSLTGGDPREEIRTVLDLRKPLYHKAADLMVDTTRMTIRDVAKTIEDVIKREVGE
jgi:shikimate kinase